MKAEFTTRGVARDRDARDVQNGQSTPSIKTLVVNSDALFNGNKTILISHEGELYQLRITQSNKLILTK